MTSIIDAILLNIDVKTTSLSIIAAISGLQVGHLIGQAGLHLMIVAVQRHTTGGTKSETVIMDHIKRMTEIDQALGHLTGVTTSQISGSTTSVVAMSLGVVLIVQGLEITIIVTAIVIVIGRGQEVHLLEQRGISQGVVRLIVMTSGLSLGRLQLS